MKAYCLASSSAGNCYVFQFDGVPPLMVECGIPYSKIVEGCRKQNINLSEVSHCLVTHAHSDHCCAAANLDMRGIEILATKDTLNEGKIDGRVLEVDKPNKIADGLYVLPFLVDHDIKGAAGFVIKTANECVIFVNDHKKWDANLKNFKPDYIFIECNYEHVMVHAQYYALRKSKKSGLLGEKELRETNIKLAQFERNINSHCSLHGTIVGLNKLNLTRCQAIFLMHLSDRYANEYKMKNEVERTFGIKTYVCQKSGGIK